MTKNPLDGLLILSTGENRDEWLAARVPVITATQAAAIAGSHPYTKLIDVWNEKTDPDYDPDALRNKWLDERAANGNEREPEIIGWASEDVRTGGEGNPFTASSALLAHPERPLHACTPDGYKSARDGGLVLIEAKTTSQDWEHDGLPQHVYDQCVWQLYVTGAVTVWVAVERYGWKGKGASRHAEFVSRWLTKVRPDEARLAFLLEKVAQFEQWLTEGVAPESDVDLREVPEPGWDATAQDLADWQEAHDAEGMLTELAEIRERVAADLARQKVIEEALKTAVKGYDGRRVYLIGSRMVAQLTRYHRTVVDTKALPADEVRKVTTWPESERVVIVPNPEYRAPE